MSGVEKLFCTAACKRAGMAAQSRAQCKALTICGVFVLFGCNMAGLGVYWALFSSRLFCRVTFGLYCFFAAQMVVSYLISSFSDPGYISKQTSVRMTRICQLCGTVKPVRSHHCSQCGRCILKMDHFCAWIHNGVGAGNYAQFLQLLLFSGWCFLYSTGLLIVLLAMPQKPFLGVQYGVGVPSLAVTAAFGFIVLKLLGFHVALIRSNQTTIEFYENATSRRLNPAFRPPFSKTPRENVREVFPHPALLLVPFIRLRSQLPDNGFYHYDPLTGKDFAAQQDDNNALVDIQQPRAPAKQREHEFSSQSASENIDISLITSRRGSISSTRSGRIQRQVDTPMIPNTRAESVLSENVVQHGDKMVLVDPLPKPVKPTLTTKEEQPEVEFDEPKKLLPLVQDQSRGITPDIPSRDTKSVEPNQAVPSSEKKRRKVKRQVTQIENGEEMFQAAK